MSEGAERIVCPKCQAVTGVPARLLLPDYALHRLLEVGSHGQLVLRGETKHIRQYQVWIEI